MDENLPQVKRFVDLKGYQFKFLYYGNQSEVFKDYDIRAFPTYYFIDKNGNLAMSPAPSPEQNSEFQIFRLMRSRGDI
jgi:thioredoxin-related protein